MIVRTNRVEGASELEASEFWFIRWGKDVVLKPKKITSNSTRKAMDEIYTYFECID